MSDHLSNIMNMEESEDSSEDTVTSSTGKDRVSSLMDMEYEEDTDKSVEPKETGIQKDPILNAKKESSDEEEKEDKKPKEEKETKEEKEEKKIEAEKKRYAYKADGEDVEEELTDEELKSRLSGSRAIQKRFTELDQKNKEFAKKEQEVNETVNYVKQELAGIKDGFEKDINEFKQNGVVKGNPIKSIYNLIDKMGLDAAEYEKAVFFHHLPEVAKFLDMDDSQRDAFLLGRENEWLRKRQDAVKGKEREAAEYKANLEKENSVKRQAGVSEELFSELKEELSAKGIDKPTTDQILEWHKVKPAYTRAEGITKLVPDADIHKVAKLLLEFPQTTDEWMLNELGYKSQQDKKIVEELKAKAVKPKAKPVEDEDEDPLFDSFRGRGRKRN